MVGLGLEVAHRIFAVFFPIGFYLVPVLIKATAAIAVGQGVGVFILEGGKRGIGHEFSSG
jgi:hypothetical protein